MDRRLQHQTSTLGNQPRNTLQRPNNVSNPSEEAQREACAAFILSQKHEGWTVLPTLYDDGGFSGGTMERPALKRLIADIEAGEIGVVV